MSWKITKLGQVCDFQGGSQPPKSQFIYESKKDYVRFLQIRDFKSDKNITYIPISKKNRICYEDDILIGRYGASVGNILKGKSGAYNVALMKTIPNDKIIDRGWLYAYLCSDLFQKPLIEKSTRSAQNGFSKDDISGFDFPLPPLPIQKQIVEKLDAAFADIDKAISATQKNIESAGILKKRAVLKKIHELPSSCLRNFEEVCDFVRGPFGGSLKKSIFVEEGFAVYEQQHPINDQFENFRYFISEEKFHEMKRFRVKVGDILMSCSGVTLGKTGIVPKNSPEGIINQALLKISPSSEIKKEYLQILMRSDYFQRLIWDVSGGAAQPNVPSVKVIKQFKIPVPSLEIQDKLCEWEGALESLNLSDIWTRKLKNIQSLKTSILNQAFSGELTKDAA